MRLHDDPASGQVGVEKTRDSTGKETRDNKKFVRSCGTCQKMKSDKPNNSGTAAFDTDRKAI